MRKVLHFLAIMQMASLLREEKTKVDVVGEYRLTLRILRAQTGAGAKEREFVTIKKRFE